MRIAYHMPFKPLGHPVPSGDLAIGTELHDFLHGQGHVVESIGSLRTRWIYWRPWTWPAAALEARLALARAREMRAGMWLTYHNYYKAPDLLGPYVSRALSIPYVIFQGIYSTKRRRSIVTWPGFVLARRALLAASHVFANKRGDYRNLLRLLPEDRVTYVRPGLVPEEFSRDEEARQELRAAWRAGERPVVLTAAMFRPGLKARNLALAFETLARIPDDFLLVVAGDGEERERLRELAGRLLGDRVLFAGAVPRLSMRRLYSAADLFVFPGVEEPLGMVYLEAQSCGLPVVAFADGGVPEAVADGVTGLLCRPFDEEAFRSNIQLLLRQPEVRRAMGQRAAAHIRERHDLRANYRLVEEILRACLPGQ